MYHYQAKRVDNDVVSSDYTQNKNTPSIALTYKPIEQASVYGSYMEGVSAGGTAPATTKNANQMLAPSSSTQGEFGIKGTPYDSIDVSLSYFRINKINEYTDPTDNVYKQDGRQVHKGIECTVTGKIFSRLTFVGGGTLLDAEVRQAKNNTTIIGKTPINVPDQQFRAYLEYAVPSMDGLTLSAGANYYGHRPIDSQNLESTPVATTCDAGIRLTTVIRQHPTTLTLNVSNVFNKFYLAGYLDGCGLMQGDPRLLSLGAIVQL
jgi:iron complex outermembrane receptor protein